MLIGFLVIIITGFLQSGGLGESISRLRDGQRTTVADFRIDPTISLSVWSTVIGGFFLGVTYVGTNQNQSQRYLTCKNLKAAKQAVFLGFVWMGVFEFLAVLAGVSIYSYYAGCDPLTSGKISKSDQILPYFVVDVFNRVPGVPGFLLAAVFSAALSTISTAINGITTITGEDIIRKIWPNIPDVKFTTLMKVISVCYGLAFMGMAFAAATASNLLIRLTQAVIGAITGPVLGAFLLGILVPRASARGTLLGMFIGTVLGMWILVGFIRYPKPPTSLPLSTASCPVDDNPITMATGSIDNATITSWRGMDGTTIMNDMDEGEDGIPLGGFYHISFIYFALITIVPTFLIGLVQAIVLPSTKPVHYTLLSPVLSGMYHKTDSFWFQNVDNTKHTDVDKTVEHCRRNIKTEDTKM